MNTAVVLQWKDFATKIARSKSVRVPHLKEDLIEVALEVLCELSDKILDAKYPKAYLARTIDGRLLRYLKKEQKCKVVQESWTTGVQVPEIHFDYSFTERERRIVELRIEGVTIQDCARILGYTRMTISRDIKEIKRKLNEEGPQRYNITQQATDAHAVRDRIATQGKQDYYSQLPYRYRRKNKCIKQK